LHTKFRRCEAVYDVILLPTYDPYKMATATAVRKQHDVTVAHIGL